MIAVLQRINNATVYADGILSGSVGHGLYILLGVEKDDSERDAVLLSEKISKLRIFCDEAGKMNLSVKDVDGEVLVVSNFTLNANYSHGNRPDYFGGAAPDEANRLYEYFKTLASREVRRVESGEFGAHMMVSLCNEGPVTIVMDSEVLKKKK